MQPDNKTAKGRLYGLTESLLKESAIPITMRPIVAGMVKQYFERVDDSQIETIVIELATQVVPYVLGISFDDFLERLKRENGQ